MMQDNQFPMDECVQRIKLSILFKILNISILNKKTIPNPFGVGILSLKKPMGRIISIKCFRYSIDKIKCVF